MPSVNTLLARNAVDRQIHMLRLSASVRKEVIRILNGLERQLVGQLAQTNLTDFQSRRYQDMVANVREMAGKAFAAADHATTRAVRGLAAYEVDAVRADVHAAVGVDLLNATMSPEWTTAIAERMIVQGAPMSAWWAKQENDLVFRFEQEVRKGLIANETTDKIIARVRGDAENTGVVGQTRAQAAALVQTTITGASNEARMEAFRSNSDILRGVQQVSTLDERTTDICAAYDLAAWDLDGTPIDGTTLPFNGGPPRHWNCRSTLAPIVKSSEELGTNVEIAPGKRASMDGAVGDKVSFGDWLETKSKAQQDNILGEGRADLWREGKITLRDLVDQSGRPLTLDELKKL